jgi:hypothetical protein
MANALYDSARGLYLTAGLTWATDNVKVALVRGYTFSSAHANLSDITGGGGGTIVATSGNLASKTTTSGVAGAANITYTTVAAGAACANLIIYKDTGTAGTSSLIASIDTAAGLPVTPNGQDITVSWDTGANKIFKL